MLLNRRNFIRKTVIGTGVLILSPFVNRSLGLADSQWSPGYAHLENQGSLAGRIEQAHATAGSLRREGERQAEALVEQHRGRVLEALAELDRELDRGLEARLEKLEARATQAIARYTEVDQDTVDRLADRAVEWLFRDEEAGEDES